MLMARLVQILFLCSAIMLPAGCAGTQKEPDIKGIKIGDLAPAGQLVQPKALRTTNIEVINYELPAENFASLDDIWRMLNPGSLRYNDSNSFTANGLRAAMGEFAAFNKVSEMLKSANATKLPTTSLLMSDNQPELLRITRMPHKIFISYMARQGAVKNAEVGPGIVGLQISARQIISSSMSPRTDRTDSSAVSIRQLASINVVPAILASTDGVAPALVERLRENDLRINSAGISAIIKPGDFVMLCPREYKLDEITAANRFFTKPGPKPAIRIFLLVCVSIF
jgi:hypothetical protein